ncbi:MAG: heme-binding protein [Candidatus Omnitrophota bacterium]
MGRIEMPSYKVIRRSGPIEVRGYSPVLSAEVEVDGERSKAINAGFRLLADYIFGNNEPKKAIAMTAPVIQQKGQKIAMTAPVVQSKAGQLWKVRFTMPSCYTPESLPKPNNPRIRIVPMPVWRAVVLRFSGSWTEGNWRKHLSRLDAFVKKEGLVVGGEPVYLFYNPPWTLPFLRRNEISYTLADGHGEDSP